ncbi:MAG: isopenicillin N synthase family oxygenase [Bdellovibrionaceae bacterium]|nr:isopenicillin N synthase family oxygenase [Pseudobdellovibrionaceae bacterium]
MDPVTNGSRSQTHTTTPTASSNRKVPELSLNSYLEGTATDRQRFVDSFFIGLKDYGFIVLKDHPIPTDLLNKAYSLLEQLFALPLETRMAYAKIKGGQRGYTPFGKEHAKDAPVSDLKEFWHVGRELDSSHRYFTQYPQNVWPKELPEFEPTFKTMYNALDSVGHHLLEALTQPLDVPKNFFAQIADAGNSILRLLHYPPIPAGTDPRCVRAAAHEDINLITILVSATTSGLELKDRDGTWLPIESDPNSLIVDAGDMLQRLTNHVIPSTTHRVVNPADATSSRYSMPYFMHPNPDALLTCLPSCVGSGEKYPPITAEDFLMQRLREIGLI